MVNGGRRPYLFEGRVKCFQLTEPSGQSMMEIYVGQKEDTMKKVIDVLNFGDLCVDLLIEGKDPVPEFGQKEKLVEDYSLVMGGSGGIFACQTAKLNLRTAVAGMVGNDSFGEVILSAFRNAGVITEYVMTHPGLKTGITVHLKTADDRAMLTYAGTIDSLGREDIPEGLLESVRHFHLSSYFLMKRIQPHYPEILRKLKAHGATISLDTNWDPEEKWDCIGNILPLVDVFLPNEGEARAISGEPDIHRAIRKLREQVPVLVLKRGGDGASVYTRDEEFHVPVLPVKVIDAVGAGDSFDGGFIYGFLNGCSLEECARIGCICGGLNTRAAGGTAGQPRLKEMQRYLEEMKQGKM